MRKIRRLFVLGTVMAMLAISFAAAIPTPNVGAQENERPAPEKYSRIEFTDTFDAIAPVLAETGVIANLLTEDDPVVAEVNAAELAALDAAGVTYRVLIDDASAFYANRARLEGASRSAAPQSQLAVASPVPQPANFEVSPPGSMGGFYTYTQVLAELDQMAAFRPDLITVKQSIGTTLEGRPIYMVKISDNPGTDESEPEVFYNSLTHAREPMAMAQNIFYMWHLLEEYDNDPDIKNLVDNTEMYFVPVINVDGYLYNEQTNPNGGGLWRKNLRDNGDGSFGVDLNRNFGYEWGFDNQGSSPTGSSNTYRGASAFSEPETQVFRDFVLSRNFVISLNYHSAVGLLIYPYGYSGAAGTANAKFPVLAEIINRDNGFPYGTAPATLYAANGVTSDWLYGSADVFGFTPEVGPVGGGFWPAPSQIVSLAQDWVESNKMAARLSGVWAEASNVSAAGAVDAGATGQVEVALTSRGLDDGGTFTVTATALTSNVTAVCSPLSFSGLTFDQQVTGSCDFDVSASATIGDPIELEIAVNNGDYDIQTFTASFTVADPNSTAVLDASFDGGTDGFGYSDDLFRSTNQGFYESGQWNSTGGFSGGGLEVVLGGINNNDILNMSGGWSQTFNLTSPSDVSVTLRYDLRQGGAEESDEASQALLSIDGTLIGNSPNDYLAQINGDGESGPPITTGWQQVTLSAGQLGAGNHTIEIGGFMNKKTFANEVTTVVFDDVVIDATPTGPVNQAPTAVASASVTAGETPLDVDFDASASTDGDGTIVSYAWDFGDGGSDTGVAPSHTYSTAGSFTATVTVTDDDGATDTDSVTITVTDPPPNQDPVASASASATSGDVPLTVTFDGSASTDGDGTIVSYAWDFGDGGSDTGVAPTNVYNAIGVYTVTLTVTDDDGATASDTLSVTVTDPSSTTLLASSFDASEDGFVYADDTFRSTNLPQYASGQWDVAGGFSGGGIEVALGGINGDDVFGMSGGWSNTFTLSGQTDVVISLRYDLRQIGTEEADEVGEALVSVDGVLIGIPPNDWVDQIQGDGNSGPPITTGWQQVSLAVGELGAGTHTITLGGYFSKKTFPDETTTVVYDDLFVTGTPVDPPVNVDPVAVASSSVTSGDAPLSVSFDGSGSSDSDGTIVSYAWDFGDGGSDTGVAPAYVFTTAGSFTVTLTVTDDDGATATDTVDITVTDPPSPGPIVESGIVSAVGDNWQTVTLTNTYQSPVVIATVRLPDSTQDPVVARVRNAGATSFELRVQTTNGVNAAAFDVHYVVADEGVYTQAEHGVTMEVVRADAVETARLGSWTLEQRTYTNSYTSPVVIGQVMSDNDPAWSVFWASSTTSRNAPPNATGFAAGKHVGEDPNNTRATELIGYIVIEAGDGSIGGLNYEAGVGADTVRGVPQTTTGYDYALTGGGSPLTAVISAAAMDGGNGGWPVLYGFAPVGVGRLTTAYDEDIAKDSERNHTTEQVAYLVLGTAFG